ncbi:DUF3006 family protein [Sutcliffiella cohnii]|uniref:DUF3006 family protein n=1 Tax=Sutcliffiella TaxID=2837511 RepID=UPI0022DD9165|nr:MULTISPECIES: DUF3006 family protein [Sutcliffiella]MED4019031.1 DUF3006 family protein [Sutcliffiella cohnii]WBL13757.1 DUF3006 family protein [Sutcliffiella sp. NC1]
MKGYLDRIEDDKYAVILVEEIGKEYVLHKDQLPHGSRIHSYFDVKIEDDRIISLTLDEKASISEQQKVDSMMAKLRSKNKGSKFSKK